MVLAEKEIVIDATGANELQALARDAKEIGVKRLLSRGASIKAELVDGLSIVQVSSKEGDGNTAAWVQINGPKDVDAAVEASKKGHSFVVVQCNNWKVIPLENLVADFQRRKQRLYAYMKEKSEIELAFNILEKGVDGIVIPAQSLKAARDLVSSLNPPVFPTAVATVKKIVDAGVGERACIDTASQLSVGEGLLIGSKSSFFFLVHSETIPSEYIPTRPFRVNAGAIHSYVLGAEGKTRYLSEIQSGDKVQVVTRSGTSRPATVGRVKIERRPLLMVIAECENLDGSVMLQNAETIRLVSSDGSPVPVTELREGDKVLVHLETGGGRHFGGQVDEFIVER